MPTEYTYDYAIVRVVPHVERGEYINAGVILSCVDDEFLDARIELDEARLRALDPTADLDVIRAGLQTIRAVCAGGAAAVGQTRAVRCPSRSYRGPGGQIGWCGF